MKIGACKQSRKTFVKFFALLVAGLRRTVPPPAYEQTRSSECMYDIASVSLPADVSDLTFAKERFSSSASLESLARIYVEV